MMTSVDDGEWGYHGRVACHAAGVTYRQLDYWGRVGLLVPSLRSNADPRRLLYSVQDIVLLNICRHLLAAGCRLSDLRPVRKSLRDVPDVAGVTIVSDGETVYVCRTADEVTDLLQSLRVVFAINVRTSVAEVNDTLRDCPPAERGHRRGSSNTG
jgi:DNA-binding transcriptional MerR regulator